MVTARRTRFSVQVTDGNRCHIFLAVSFLASRRYVPCSCLYSAPISIIFSMNASSGRVPSLHPCGVGMLALPNFTSNGPKNITDALILSPSSVSTSYE